MASTPVNPVPDGRGGPLRRLIERLCAFLARLFRRKSPIGFDDETGSWVTPDAYLPADPAEGDPPPIANTDCSKSHVIYAVAVNAVAICNAAAKQAAVADATARAQAYFRDHFECKNEDCIQKVAEVIWTGSSCNANPVVATGAVLLRMRCEVEL